MSTYQQQTYSEATGGESDSERGGLLQNYTTVNRLKHACSRRWALWVMLAVGAAVFITLVVVIDAAVKDKGSSPSSSLEDGDDDGSAGSDMETLPGTLENLAMDSAGALIEYVTLVRLPCTTDASTRVAVRHDYDVTGLAWAGLVVGLGSGAPGLDLRDSWRRHGLVYDSFARITDARITCPTAGADGVVPPAPPVEGTNRCATRNPSGDAELASWSKLWLSHVTSAFRVPASQLPDLFELLDVAVKTQLELVDTACRGEDTTDIVSDTINTAGAVGSWLDDFLGGVVLASST